MSNASSSNGGVRCFGSCMAHQRAPSLAIGRMEWRLLSPAIARFWPKNERRSPARGRSRLHLRGLVAGLRLGCPFVEFEWLGGFLDWSRGRMLGIWWRLVRRGLEQTRRFLRESNGLGQRQELDRHRLPKREWLRHHQQAIQHPFRNRGGDGGHRIDNRNTKLKACLVAT